MHRITNTKLLFEIFQNYGFKYDTLDVYEEEKKEDDYVNCFVAYCF